MLFLLIKKINLLLFKIKNRSQDASDIKDRLIKLLLEIHFLPSF